MYLPAVSMLCYNLSCTVKINRGWDQPRQLLGGGKLQHFWAEETSSQRRGNNESGESNGNQSDVYRATNLAKVETTDFVRVYVCYITQSCLTLCDPMDCSICPWNSPGKNTGVVAISFSWWSSQLGDQTWVFHITSRFSSIWGIREALLRLVT